MKKVGRALFGMALVGVLVLGLSAALPQPAQAFEWFDTCPPNNCSWKVASLGICENDVGQICRVHQEGSYPYGLCLGECF